MELESEYGVPSVGVHADVFAKLVESVNRANGMPAARHAFVPTPVLGKSLQELRDYVEGDDPVTGRPFTTELVEFLTNKIAESELRGLDIDRSTPRFVEASSEDDLQELFHDNRWTDYLPITLPTEERVEAMLRGTSHDPEEIVGQLRATNYREKWAFTVEKVAINAAMAGAHPSYMPVILALASTGLTARNSSTSSSAAMVVVNGPIRNEIEMNMGLGALGPYNHANATIGRAFGLLSQNLQGGSVLGETYMGALGNSTAFTNATFAENEEKSPWTPYHVEQGFNPEESAVSCLYVWGNAWFEGLRDPWQENVQRVLSGLDPHFGTVLVMDPIAAEAFVAKGLTTKQSLIDWIHSNVKIPARQFWGLYTSQTMALEKARLGVEPYASFHQADPDDLLPMFPKEKIRVVVVGGSSIAQWSPYIGGPRDARFLSPTDTSTVSVDTWR